MISIVDDDEAVRESTEGLVRSLGYLAATFSSAEEFLSSERLHHTSCLITDLQMPGLSGVELQRRLIAGGHHMPIIFISGSVDISTAVRAIRDGAVDFLQKPYPQHQLMDAIKKAMRGACG